METDWITYLFLDGHCRRLLAWTSKERFLGNFKNIFNIIYDLL